MKHPFPFVDPFMDRHPLDVMAEENEAEANDPSGWDGPEDGLDLHLNGFQKVRRENTEWSPNSNPNISDTYEMNPDDVEFRMNIGEDFVLWVAVSTSFETPSDKSKILIYIFLANKHWPDEVIMFEPYKEVEYTYWPSVEEIKELVVNQVNLFLKDFQQTTFTASDLDSPSKERVWEWTKRRKEEEHESLKIRSKLAAARRKLLNRK